MDNIVYESDGKLRVDKPTPQALLHKTIDEIAQEIVPSGISYILVSNSDMPSDDEGSGYWELLPDNTVGISDANKIIIAKDKKLSELKEYYESDIVRKVTHNNRLVYVRKKSIDASTYLRGRVRDNVEVTECEWFYDDGGASSILDLDGITAVNKLVIDKEQVIFKLKKYHQAAINALTTEAEVNSYDITSDINGLSWI